MVFNVWFFRFHLFNYIFFYCKWGGLPLMSNPASVSMVKMLIIYVDINDFIFIVQTITQALFHYFAFKYRGKQGQKALYFADNNKLEFIWSSIPALF
jgi:cytochrome c oxidase subunit 2